MHLVAIGLGAEGGIGLETGGIDANESLGIGGVVIERLTAVLNVHGGQIGMVQAGLGITSADDAVALVQLNLHHTLNVALGVVDGVTDEVHLGSEPESVVAQTGELGRHTLGDALHLAVHAHALQIKVGLTEEGSTGSLVDATRLDTDEAVLHNVNAADAVLASDLIAVQKDVEGIGLDGTVGLVGDLDGDAGLELNGNRLGHVGGVLGRGGHLEHGLLIGTVGILEHTRLVRGVVQILVDGVVGLGLGIDGDVVLLAVGEEVLASLEALDELGVAPGGDHLGLGHEGLGAHLETDLVVALAGGAVGEVGSALLVGDADHLLGDAGTSDGGTEQVARFVDGVALDGLEDVVGDELCIGKYALTRWGIR